MVEGKGETPRTSDEIGARILVLSEDHSEALALRRMLQSLPGEAAGLTVARSPEEARTLLQADERDCLVVATSEAIGHESIPAVLRHDDLVHRLPVVVVGDGPAWQAGKHALSLGADDYVARADLDGDRLVSAVLLAIERGRRTAIQPPIRDALTGLPNRLLFMDRLRLAFARRERSRTDVLVMLLDLSSFKEINGLLGHAAGDMVLRTVAERLRMSFRASDTVARLGGDKFAVICEGPELRSLLPRLEAKLQGAFSDPIPIDGENLAVLASTGVAFAADDDERDADLLLRRAGAAMLEEKRRAERPREGNGQSIDDLRV